MEQSNEIRCPKCNSNQLTANKKGFSGAKAVGGAILTGGIGLLAGTIGSNKIKITCLACGNEFRPGEGKTHQTLDNRESTNSFIDEINIKLDERERIFTSPENMDEALLKILKQGLFRGAVNHYRTKMGVSQEIATEYVEKFIIDNNLSDKVKRSGCFIATACYGNYDAPEVLVLRQYRDEKLLNSFLGKVFVEFYYSISPFIANLISKSELLKKIVKQLLLRPIIIKLHRQNNARNRSTIFKG